MYISDLSKLINAKGNIYSDIEAEEQEFVEFLFLVVRHTTKKMPSTLTPIDLKCFNKGCHGLINASLKPGQMEIHWYCPVCEKEGEIGNWQGSKWDNSEKE